MDDHVSLSFGSFGRDRVEKEWWQRLAQQFPHYETLWANLIVPLSGRPRNQELRTDLPEEWERLAEQHYSIFLHLAAAIERSDQCSRKLLAYEDVYSHLATAFDLVDAFLFTLDWILQGTRPALAPELQNQSEFSERLSEWAKSDRGKRHLEQVEKKGRSFAFDPFRESVKKHFEGVVDTNHVSWSEYHSVAESVKSRRNIFIHEFIPAKLITGVDSRQFAPRGYEVLKEHLCWSKTASSPELINESGDIQELAVSDIEKVVSIVNKLWGQCGCETEMNWPASWTNCSRRDARKYCLQLGRNT
jgi:hypothetical protein